MWLKTQARVSCMADMLVHSPMQHGIPSQLRHQRLEYVIYKNTKINERFFVAVPR